MEYWIQSIPPLVIRKAYLSTRSEVMEWIEYVLTLSQEMHADRGEEFPPNKEIDVFKECFVLIKLDPYKNKALKHVFKMDADSSKWLSIRAKNLSTLKKTWKKTPKSQVQRVGRPKKSSISITKKKELPKLTKVKISSSKKGKGRKKDAL